MVTHSSGVEILVHVDAPSRVADDAAYRQLAQAYLAFEPDTQTSLPGPDTEGQSSRPSPPNLYQPRLSSSQEITPPASSEAIVIDSQDLSFQGALDNRSSPRLRTVERKKVDRDVIPSSLPDDSGTEGTWCAPPSQISDSYPMPDAAVYVSPTQVLQRFARPLSASSPRASPSSPSARRGLGTPGLSPSPRHAEPPSSLPGLEPECQPTLKTGHVNARKVVPVTPPVPAAAPRKRGLGEDENQEGEATWDVTHISASDVSSRPPSTSSPRAESEPPPVKKSKTGGGAASGTNKAKNLVRSSSDTATARQPSARNSKKLITVEIRSPSPPVSIGDIEPAHLISDKLAKLAADLSSRYRPEANRDIQPFERGYWLLDCSTWSESTCQQTWEFLTSYLRSGLAGWGVWCRRDEWHRWIRLYCWGHIVKHTYLLLYLASGRHLKLTGAEWKDGAGEVALRVLAHEKHS